VLDIFTFAPSSNWLLIGTCCHGLVRQDSVCVSLLTCKTQCVHLSICNVPMVVRYLL
jgi:hypothetical protein